MSKYARRSLGLLLVCLWPAVFVSVAAAGEKKAAPKAEKVVLSETGFWRCWFYWKPEAFGKAAVLNAALQGKPEPAATKTNKAGKKGGAKKKKKGTRHPFSFPPPAGWTKTDFDASSWSREPGPFFPGYGHMQPQTLAAICLRGCFKVADPAKAEGLTLNLVFRGGAVVYLNGKEIARAHLPEGKLTPDTFADDYPFEVYCHPDGKKGIRWGWHDPQKFKDRCQKRIRRLSAVKLPKEALFKGSNVLAVELHRTSFDPNFRKLKYYWTSKWSTVGLLALRLTAPSAAAVTPNVNRPAGLQLWNTNPLSAVFDVDYGDPFEKLRPIKLVGTRNGVFSGEVVLGADQPLKGAKAECSALKQKGGEGVIPPAAIQVRYALPGIGGAGGEVSSRLGVRRPTRFDVLAATPPAVVPVRKKSVSRGRRAPRFGAVLPIWVTVKVTAEAPVGDYEGTLTVQAEGFGPTAVPVNLKVCGWKLPDPRNFETHVGLVESPDSVALQYKVPLWSEKHWALLEKSLKLLGEVGNKTVFIPVMARTNFGNEESMVRWIKQPDGSYKHDYSIMNRYLDLWGKWVGKPDVVCFYAWEAFAGGGYFGRKGNTARGVQVTVFDPATKKTELLTSPVYGTPESVKFWKPVYDDLRENLKKRGLTDDNFMLGIAGDTRPSKTVTDFFLKVAPWAKWVLRSHAAASRFASATVGYYSHVWGVKFCNDPDEPDRFTHQGRWYGWRQKFRRTVFPRSGAGAINPPLHPNAPFGTYRKIPEGMLVCGYRGFGGVGADFWSVMSGSHGRNTGREIIARYPGTSWNQLNLNTSTCAVTAPGPEGAIATIRFEMMREGVQEAETRIFLERALTTKALRAKLGAERVKRIQALLDLRTRMYRTACKTSWNWFAGSGWQERDADFFNAAAEVKELLGK